MKIASMKDTSLEGNFYLLIWTDLSHHCCMPLRG
jgi:hypothetical protein